MFFIDDSTYLEIKRAITLQCPYWEEIIAKIHQSIPNIENTQKKSDPLLFEAAKLIVSHQEISSALLQRNFSIGHSRAESIMVELEKKRIIKDNRIQVCNEEVLKEYWGIIAK